LAKDLDLFSIFYKANNGTPRIDKQYYFLKVGVRTILLRPLRPGDQGLDVHPGDPPTAQARTGDKTEKRPPTSSAIE